MTRGRRVKELACDWSEGIKLFLRRGWVKHGRTLGDNVCLESLPLLQNTKNTGARGVGLSQPHVRRSLLAQMPIENMATGEHPGGHASHLVFTNPQFLLWISDVL